MSVSSFQKLLVPTFTCNDYFVNPNSLKTTPWPDASQHAKAFRDYLKTLAPDVDSKQLVNAYLLTQEDIKNLLAQNSGKVDALRVYMGKENVMGGWVIKLYAVACQFNKKTNKYDDFGLPAECPDKVLNLVAFENLPMLGEVRPCPSNCANENFMNNP